MVDCTLYEGQLSYPSISAVAGGKLAVTKEDKITLSIPTVQYQIVGVRASSTDPWEIQITPETEVEALLEFARGPYDINPDTLGWKSMADLALKAHMRPPADQVWELVAMDGANPFCVADASDPIKHKAATLAEAKTRLEAHVSESGDIVIKAKASTTVFWSARRRLVAQIGAAINSILANTGVAANHHTLPSVIDFHGGTKSRVDTLYRGIQMTGTEDISVGNYAGGDMDLRIVIPAYDANALVDSVRTVSAGTAYTIPSITLDKIRRAAKAGQSPVIALGWSAESKVVSARYSLDDMDWDAQAAFDVARMAVLDPGSFNEIDFDQANSLNVLAAAAFAGLGGLVAAGTATELQNLLMNTPLSAVFAQVASALGAVTSSVVAGYVSALVACYTQGWISNDQLFDLSNHVSWIQAGYKTILLAAGAGVAIDSTAALFNYLGVSSNIVSTAITAAGGAATAAGVALGMASVMAKVVKHTYWGV